jgi:enterochelin esterase-like enzyme
MNISRFSCIALTILIFTPNASAEEKRPARPAPVVSPLIDASGKVTFQIKAPGAEKVTVSGQMVEGNHDMVKNDEGLWTVSLESVVPGIYEYSFTVDGLKMLDPGNPKTKPMRSPQTSILHIPGDHSFDFKEVPHGTVHYHGYQSAPINRFREMQVYTPPGYETGSESYPLLVLQHGHSDCFATWVTHGKAHWILDNLIASGEAVPMIVTMLDGHPIPGSYGDGRSGANTEELRKDLLEAALPMVEKLYRVKPGRENCAIIGLSMGGLHSLSIGLNALDTFASVGAMSAAIPEENVLAPLFSDVAQANEKLNLLWVACGKDDFLLKENEKMIALFTEKGLNHEWHLTEGSHSWPVWRGYLADFVPRLFR